MINGVELRELASQITIVIDSPESVKRQIKQISFAQKKLKILKKELSLSIRNINQEAAQANADTLLSVLSDISGNRKLAGQARAIQRKKIDKNKKQVRQPYIELQMQIDQLILEGDRLKLLAQEYCLDPEGVTARIQAEEEQKILRHQEQLKYAEELKRQQEEELKQQIEKLNRQMDFWGGYSGFIALVMASIACGFILSGFGRLIQGMQINWFLTVFWLLTFILSINLFIKKKFFK
ncbi:hypothetical protein [Nodularia sp. UHCC 0506]|uniref:hypothetical protein n=1 Tax=Nodularia sp. UHCC 0506 TaxID=3110243 RepID=UPI002B1EC3C9|nr:hypothetical protein [Nodularia sp. UHCC 0506]MEA5513429.1 hypothetical protein [Nodularia sp. UHCC 0506]